MKNERYIAYDIMRIIACFGVIMIHCAVFEQEALYNYSTWEYQGIKLWGVLSRWAVPAFVMLSGMLVIPKADEISIKRLFIHRVFRMLFAYIAWSCVYSFYNTYVLEKVYATTKLKTFIDGCFSGEIHMWYLPMLGGLYLISPILSIIVRNASRKWSAFWIAGLVMFTSIIPFIEFLNIKFVSVIVQSINGYMDLQFLGGWTLYFVLGYYIGIHTFTKKERILIYSISMVALIFTFYFTIIYCMVHGKARGVLSYEYPNIVLFSGGIMIFFKEEVSNLHFKNTTEKRIIGLSKLTFGIYLIHVLLLKVFYFWGINIQMFHPLLSVPLVALAVFLSGGGIIWVVRKCPLIGTYLA